MTTREIFVYYIFNKDKKALYVNENGAVMVADDNFLKPDGKPARLQHAPEGWEATLFKYGRNVKYWGLTRDFTTPMNFHKDALTIITKLFADNRYESVAYLGIAKLNLFDLPYKYEKWHLTELNFVKYNKGLTGVTIEALEGGPSKYLKANENTEYEIDITEDTEVKHFLADGIILPFTRTYLVANDQIAVNTDSYVLGMVQEAFEGEPVEVIFQDQFFKSSTAYPNENWIIDAGKLQDVLIKGSIKLKYTQNITIIVRAEVNDHATSGGTVQYNLINRAGTAGEEVTVNFTQAITIPKGYNLNFKHTMFNPVNTGEHYRILDGEIKIEYGYRHSESYVDGLYLMRVFSKLVEKVTEGLYTAKSAWLTGRKDMMLTSGDALRKIEKAKMKISLVDFFQSLPFAGLGIENNQIVIEPLTYFFSSSKTIQLGQVKDATLKVADDLLGNVIKAGYEQQDYDDVNGRNEFNQGQVWTTPVKKVLKDLDIVSKVRADAMGAELIRINYAKKSTTDNSGDNDTWMINVDTEIFTDVGAGIDYQKYYRVAYDSVDNLPYWETWFNLELSPKKNILQQGRLFRSLFDGLDGQYIKLETSDRNKDIVTTLGAVVYKESDPIQISDTAMGTKIFLPYYFNFTTKVPVNLLTVMEAKPYDKVEFIWKDIKWYGYVWDGAVRPSDNDTQKWILLAAPENDISKW